MSDEFAIVNVSRGYAVTEDGQQLPVTSWIANDEEDCRPEDAAACIAGPDRDGLWLTIDLRGREKVTFQ